MSSVRISRHRPNSVEIHFAELARNSGTLTDIFVSRRLPRLCQRRPKLIENIRLGQKPPARPRRQTWAVPSTPIGAAPQQRPSPYSDEHRRHRHQAPWRSRTALPGLLNMYNPCGRSQAAKVSKKSGEFPWVGPPPPTRTPCSSDSQDARRYEDSYSRTSSGHSQEEVVTTEHKRRGAGNMENFAAAAHPMCNGHGCAGRGGFHWACPRVGPCHVSFRDS